ncbi:MAG: hypothetical protein ACE1ZA_13190, partial [Pseudomonadales bacterium]
MAINHGDRHIESLIKQVPYLAGFVAADAVSGNEQYLWFGNDNKTTTSKVDTERRESRGGCVNAHPVGVRFCHDLHDSIALLRLDTKWDQQRSVTEGSLLSAELQVKWPVFTTIDDLAKWDHNFYDPRLGGQRLLDDMH